MVERGAGVQVGTPQAHTSARVETNDDKGVNNMLMSDC